jgi:hypothetical protein
MRTGPPRSDVAGYRCRRGDRRIDGLSRVDADVVCIGAASLPDGTKLARLVGRLTEPAFSARSLLFNVSDTGLPGGEGNTFAGSLSPAAAEDIPCEPTPGNRPDRARNISIMVD